MMLLFSNYIIEQFFPFFCKKQKILQKTLSNLMFCSEFQDAAIEKMEKSMLIRQRLLITCKILQQHEKNVFNNHDCICHIFSLRKITEIIISVFVEIEWVFERRACVKELTFCRKKSLIRLIVLLSDALSSQCNLDPSSDLNYPALLYSY